MGANLRPEQKTFAYWKPLIEKHGSILGVHLASGHSEGTIRRELQRLGIPYDHTPRHVECKTLMDPDLERVYLSQPSVPWEDAILLFDPHCPYHNVTLINEMVDTARRLQIKKLAIIGDLTDLKKQYKKEPQAEGFGLTDELRVTREVIEFLAGWFDEIVATIGNHDFRLIRLLENQEDAIALYNLIMNPNKTGPFRLLRENYLLIGEWLYAYHPFRMRKSKGSLSEEMGDHNQKSNLGAHSHRWSMAIHDNGKEVVAEGLHATDPLFHNYHNDRLDTYSSWVPGFWIVKGKSLYPYTIHDRIWNPLREV
jgi:hypothetical protein